MFKAPRALLFVLPLLACTDGGIGDLSAFSDSAASAQDTANLAYYPDDQLIISGKTQFRAGNYGKSFTFFKKALEVYPNDPEALLGFAASADMLRRFDQSDPIYRRLRGMIGNTVVFHNNLGYSYLLRGDLIAARQEFLLAYEIDPTNETTANNLELLRNSINHPTRGPGDLQGI